MNLPRISGIEHLAISRLRNINGTTLRELATAQIIIDSSEPVAVLLPYSLFLSMQARIAESDMDSPRFRNAHERRKIAMGTAEPCNLQAGAEEETK